MAVEGLEIAPGGIGSGEAQIAKTPFTEKAFMYRVESDRLRKAKEEEAFANELSKIDLDGIHTQDAEDINKKYQELIDSYASVSKAKGRNDRLTSKVLYEQKKKDLLGAISGSKEFNKQLAEIGSKIIGSRDEWEDNSLEMFNQYKKNKSFGVTIDETAFRKKAKPEDILKVKSDVLEFARVPVKENIVVTKGGKQGTMVQETITLDPARYSTAMAYKIQQSPTYKSTLIAQYKSDYENSPNYSKDAGDAGVLNYAINREYQTDLATEKKKKQEGGFNQFDERDNNQTNFNFGGGGRTLTSTWSDPIVNTVNLEKKQTVGKTDFTTISSIPVIDEAVVKPGTFSFVPSDGYFELDGTYAKSNKQMDMKASSKIVVLPVTKSAQGYSLVSSDVSTTDSRTGKISKRASAQPKSGYEYIAFIQGENDKGKTILVPLENVPSDVVNKADYPAFKYILDQGYKTTLKQLGGESNQQSGATDVSKLFK
jgi:hypothetical protein